MHLKSRLIDKTIKPSFLSSSFWTQSTAMLLNNDNKMLTLNTQFVWASVHSLFCIALDF